MLKLALLFFIISLVAGLFGFTNIAAGAAGIAKVFFFIAVTIFLIILIVGVGLGMAQEPEARLAPRGEEGALHQGLVAAAEPPAAKAGSRASGRPG